MDRPTILSMFTSSPLGQPTVALVAPSLSCNNYGTWIRAITIALRAKNKLGLVDGTLKKPTDPKELSQWERCNDLVGSWILNSVSTEIRSSISYADTARDICEKAVAERLQQDRGMKFLQGLHDRYAALRNLAQLASPSNVVPLPLSDNPSFDFPNDVHDAHPSPVVPSLVDDIIVAHYNSSSIAPTTPTDPTPSSMEPDSTLSHAGTSPPLERPSCTQRAPPYSIDYHCSIATHDREPSPSNSTLTEMATANPFDLLGDDDNDDPSQLIALQQQKIASKKSVSFSPEPAKFPSKPIPLSQPVKEARNEAANAPRGGGRGGAGRGRGGRGNGPSRDFISNRNLNGSTGGYGGRTEDGESNKPSERGRGSHGAPRQSYRGGRHSDYGEGDGGGDFERPSRRQFDRHSGTGRGHDIKREGAGRANWGNTTDEVLTQEPEEPANTEDKDLIPEKQTEKDDALALDVNKEGKEGVVNEVEEKEPEVKEMTLDEYQIVLEEKRKALLAMKTEERKVDLDKEFESMQQLSLKKGYDDVFIKLGSDKDVGQQRKENAERVKKSVRITEFLKPAEGERYYGAGGRGRGRGRGDHRQFRGGFGGGNTSSPAAPSIEDPGQFPTLGGK
ncbi:hypothetical protein HHK36_006038 [Tetracentron sinense]|uniref:Hyaluronan/mRNA-binding protein domain-containing protein n=1 Tax=Tetracentron sinense TaxID=13715 RepID=A0A834ZHX1_TETSI|nr:hypothetical protein HHK36_006038 [Tetracentron sinense]